MARGRRLSENKIRVYQKKNGQFIMTLPRKIAEREFIRHGSILKVEPAFGGGIKMEKVKVR